MAKPITAFLPNSGQAYTRETARQLLASGCVEKVYTLSSGGATTIDGCENIAVDQLYSSKTIQTIAAKSATTYTLFILHDTKVELGQFALDRLAGIAESIGASMLYSDYVVLKGEKRSNHPVIDYQFGAIRDDFNFGSMALIDSRSLKQAASELASTSYEFAGWYATRLAISRAQLPMRVGEPLYTKVESDLRKTGEQQFDYVNPRNRAVQIEMEQAATEHLKKTGVYLKPGFKPVSFEEKFEVEASVIIPVRNRVKTVPDAVKSVLEQKPKFNFNLIVVDNHSNDGTTEVLREIAAKDSRLIHHIPERHDLGIGGCWNEGVHHPKAGRFVCQLDSDDLYIDEHVLTRIVDVFYAEKVAMVIGSYQMVNFQLQQIPPGVIDHKEWTPENGRNNALRINGLGAPRCFYTPILRKIKVPNVSYGEDYAVAIAISREYQIGRIYDPVYLCRRWEGNSDADLDTGKSNAFNFYKDKIRTFEMLARKKMNG